LLFTAAAGAQEESIDASGPATDDGVGEVQGQQSQQVQVQDVQVQDVQVQAASCPGARTVRTFQDRAGRHESRPDITGGAVRITYEVGGDGDSGGGELFIELRDEDGDVIESITVDENTNGEGENTNSEGIAIASTEPGRHEFVVEATRGLDYFVRLEDCTNAGARNDNDNDDDNNDDDNNDDDNNDDDNNDDDNNDGDTNDDTVDVAQTENTTAETTTAETTTAADPVSEATTADDASNADGVRDADAFRCEFFLRVVRDDRGALRAQYQDDEVVVQRFEQCISDDVIADTIPDRKLPFTGGMPLLFLAAIGIASLVVGAAVLRRGV
jgi:hypothetical protein